MGHDGVLVQVEILALSPSPTGVKKPEFIEHWIVHERPENSQTFFAMRCPSREQHGMNITNENEIEIINKIIHPRYSRSFLRCISIIFLRKNFPLAVFGIDFTKYSPP